MLKTFLQPWQIRLFGAEMWVKSRPRPQDDDDDDEQVSVTLPRIKSNPNILRDNYLLCIHFVSSL